MAEPIEEQTDAAAPERLGVLEAVLFVTEEPLPLAKLQEILGDAAPETTTETIRALALAMEAEGRGLLVQEVAGGFRLSTKPEVHPWVMKLQQVRPAKLSRAALETLAIIAYRQPITRAEVEAVRGVAIDGVLKTLLERELVRMLGRKPDAGRPMLYGTTAQFLEHFGLRELTDLPTLREINDLLGPSEAESEPRSQGAGAPPPAEPHAGSTEFSPDGEAAVGPTDELGELAADGETATRSAQPAGGEPSGRAANEPAGAGSPEPAPGDGPASPATAPGHSTDEPAEAPGAADGDDAAPGGPESHEPLRAAASEEVGETPGPPAA